MNLWAQGALETESGVPRGLPANCVKDLILQCVERTGMRPVYTSLCGGAENQEEANTT